jgi:hypothetical protein
MFLFNKIHFIITYFYNAHREYEDDIHINHGRGMSVATQAKYVHFPVISELLVMFNSEKGNMDKSEKL